MVRSRFNRPSGWAAILIVLALFDGRIVHAQGPCFGCSSSGTSCKGFASSGSVGCDDAGGECRLSGDQCGLGGGDGGGGGEGIPHHGASAAIDLEPSDFSRLIWGVLIEVGPNADAKIFAGARSRVLAAAGDGLGSRTILATLIRDFSVPSNELRFVTAVTSVGRILGPRRVTTVGKEGFDIDAEPIADGAEVSLRPIGGGESDSPLKTVLGPDELLIARVLVEGRVFALAVQAKVLSFTAANGLRVAETLSRAQSDTDGRSSSTRALNMSIFRPTEAGPTGRPRTGTWGDLKVHYR